MNQNTLAPPKQERQKIKLEIVLHVNAFKCLLFSKWRNLKCMKCPQYNKIFFFLIKIFQINNKSYHNNMKELATVHLLVNCYCLLLSYKNCRSSLY